jgi:putative intracellular protease/amidase
MKAGPGPCVPRHLHLATSAPGDGRWRPGVGEPPARRAMPDSRQGRRLTSWPSIRTDLRNAGADVVDEEVVVDGQLTTSRSPADLPAFCPAIVEQFAGATEHAHV